MTIQIRNLSDSELINVATQMFNAMNGNLANYVGVTQVQVDELQTANNKFAVDLTTHITSQAEAKANTQTKNASRAEVEQIIRTLRNIAIANGASEANINAFGIPASAGDIPSNATRPTATIDASKRLQHTIRFADEASPDIKRKPRGVMGCEIWLKLDGSPPIDETECRYLALDSATPYLMEYDGVDAGKMAHYLIRWRFNDGAVTSWGETVSATITG